MNDFNTVKNPPPGLRQPSIFRRPVMATLGRFSVGRLELTLPEGQSLTVGDEDAPVCAEISVKDEDFFRKCALGGGVGLGEAYMDGDWETPDIAAVVTWFIRNLHADPKLGGSSQRFNLVGMLRHLDRLRHRLRHNSREGSRQNIEEHYDLGNDFYQLWLDPTMTYSSARFTDDGQSLEEAQLSKYEALCQKLELSADDHVLEIGCGWGGFSCYAASRYGCRVTAITISPSQHAEAVRRVEEAGLTDLVEVKLTDYRDLGGSYDKIASIEMLEAVGHRYHQVWADKCGELLKPGGQLAVQMITGPDGAYATLRRGTDFIQRHIFPGSLLLSVGRMGEVLGKSGQFYLTGLEDLGHSYARTLGLWHDRFNGRLDEVRELGFSERFVRKWNFYLKYCEAAFSSQNISVVQAVYTRPCPPPSIQTAR